MTTRPPYWFPAKTYGWGWGLPATWQGWVVLAGYAGILVLGGALLNPAQHPTAYATLVALASAALVAVCAWKGEPPRWRWGRDGT